MQATTPFPEFNHIPLIYRREFPAHGIKNWFLAAIHQRIVTRRSFSFRNELFNALKQQYSTIHPNKATENIELLKEQNTFSVTTGHQLCLFGGPLFFIYKIITTINLANDLKKEFPNENFVPVFWMASEDHDFAEINHVHLFGKELHWEKEQGGAVGNYSTDGIAVIISELEAMKGNFSHADELISIFRKAYREETNLADATRILVNELFGEYGLVVIDGNDPLLKKLFIPVIEKEITEQPAEKILHARNELLRNEGFDPQVHPREINFFYLSKNNRRRIVQVSPGKFEEYEGNNSWTREEIISEINESPGNFSPNVLFRPLFQETILPNLAYVGGPGEIAYWKQIPGLFEHFKISEPILVPRHSAMIIENALANRMQKLNLHENELFLNEDQLIRKYIESVAGDEIHLEEYKKSFRELFDHISQKAGAVDPTLVPGVLAELQKQINYLSGLESRLRKAEKQKHEVTVNQVRSLKEKLFPKGIPQERHESIIPFYWKYGKHGIESIMHEFHSFDFRYRIFYP